MKNKNILKNENNKEKNMISTVYYEYQIHLFYAFKRITAVQG
jgi:hypothetical protein